MNLWACVIDKGMRKSFREYVENRDAPEPEQEIDPKTGNPKPLFSAPPMPGQLRSAGQRFSKSWDSAKDRNPDQFHDRFLQPRRVRAGIANNVQQFASLAKDTNDLSRFRNNGLYAFNKVIAAEKNRLKNAGQ